jgi:hypothetical protein
LANLKGRYQLGDPVVAGRIILKLMSKEKDMSVWTAFMWYRIGIIGGLF